MYFLIERYFIKSFIQNLFLTFIVLYSIAYLISFLQLANQFSTIDISIILIMKLTLLQCYTVIEKIIPIVFHIATLCFIIRLIHYQEIIAIKSLGLNIWRMIIPITSIIFILGILLTTVFNPIGHFMFQRYEKIHLRLVNQDNTIIVGKIGIWFKDEDKKKNIIINAKNIDYNKKSLTNVIFTIQYKNSNKQLIAYGETAILTKNGWTLKNVTLINPRKLSKNHFSSYYIPSSLSFNKLYSTLDNITDRSFWRLLNMFNTEQLTPKQKNHFIKLCLMPLTLIVSFFIGIFPLLHFVRINNLFIKAFISITIHLLFFISISFINKLSLYNYLTGFTINIAPLLIFISLSMLILLYKEESTK